MAYFWWIKYLQLALDVYDWCSWSCKIVFFWVFAFWLHDSAFSMLLELKDGSWIKTSLNKIILSSRNKIKKLLFRKKKCHSIFSFETACFNPWACKLIHTKKSQLPSIVSGLLALAHFIGPTHWWGLWSGTKWASFHFWTFCMSM